MPVSPLFAFFFTFQPTTRTLSVDFYSFELFPLLLSLLPSLSILFFHDTKHQFLINSRGNLVSLSCSVSKWRDKRREQNRAGRSGLPPQPLAEALLHIYHARELLSGEEEESYVIKKLFSPRGYRVMRLHCARCPNDVSARHASSG